MSKYISLVLDLFTVFTFSVLTPASFVLFGSLFNSRQFAIHVVVVGGLLAVAQTMTSIHIYSKFKISRKKNGKDLVRRNLTTRLRSSSKVRPSYASFMGKSMQTSSSAMQQSDA